MRGVRALRRIVTAALVLGTGPTALAADGGVWSVAKSTGEVWVTTTGAQKASLTQEENLKPGDTIRTGPNGRVLMVRGEESMLIAPNSVISVPAEAKDGMQTTILQQAGSIVLEVEKKNVKHFEVETPYLAAVVKGTQFIVTVNATSTSVEVRRGQVEVSDFKTGQIAQVLPGQTATSFEHGKGGLTLTGSGTFNPIEQGKPRASSIDRIQVPRNGLSGPRNASGTVIHALGHIGQSFASAKDAPSSQGVKHNGIRISSALGEVNLNVGKATHGLARGATVPGSARLAANKEASVWSGGGGTSPGAASAVSAGNANSGSGGSGGAGGAGGASASGGGSTASGATSTVASTVGSVVGAADSGLSGALNAATGNGKALGLLNGNGNGNGGVGNGNGKGNAKH